MLGQCINVMLMLNVNLDALLLIYISQNLNLFGLDTNWRLCQKLLAGLNEWSEETESK